MKTTMKRLRDGTMIDLEKLDWFTHRGNGAENCLASAKVPGKKGVLLIGSTIDDAHLDAEQVIETTEHEVRAFADHYATA